MYHRIIGFNTITQYISAFSTKNRKTGSVTFSSKVVADVFLKSRKPHKHWGSRKVFTIQTPRKDLYFIYFA